MNILIFLITVSQTPQWELRIDYGAVSAGAFNASILGVTHIYENLPNTTASIIDGVTFGFSPGSIIQSTTGLWYCELDDSSNKIWSKFIGSASPVIPYATATIIHSSTIITNDLYVDFIDVDIIEGDNITSNYITSVTIVSTTLVVDGIPLIPIPDIQWYTGDHAITNVTLDNPAYDGTLHITCITDPDISHPIEWVEDYHYSINLDDDGYIESVTPLDKWYIHTIFRFKYTKKQ